MEYQLEEAQEEVAEGCGQPVPSARTAVPPVELPLLQGKKGGKESGRRRDEIRSGGREGGPTTPL